MADNVKGTYGNFGLIFNTDSELLLVQRDDGRWNLPGGGVSEDDAAAGINDAGVAIREVLEETGLIVALHDARPIGVYSTMKHTDMAVTWHCVAGGGELAKTSEGIDARHFSPEQILALANRGDVAEGLVGGIRTLTGAVPRHIMMCLHAFTRASTIPGDVKTRVLGLCEELGISE